MTGILIDAGNTSCKYAVSSGGRLTLFMRDDGRDIPGTVKTILGGRTPDIAVLSSVRGGTEETAASLEGAARRLVVVGSGTALPISIGYRTPESLGADRISAAVGAYSLFPGENLLVFDFGTAITIDRVTDEGVFAGGNISIGLGSRISALHLLTAKLPDVSPYGAVHAFPGTSTEEALVSGAVLGTMFEIRGYIDNYPGCRIVFTGGDSIFLANKMKNPIFADHNLVLRGLAYIAEYNAQM